MNIGSHPRFQLPFAVAVVPEGPSEPKLPMGIPYYRRDFATGQQIRLSHEERKALAAEYAEKRAIKTRKRAKVAAYNALSSEERSKVDAKKASATVKREATKLAKKEREVVRAPHTFVKVARPLDRFIPPPAIEKPLTPPPVSPNVEAEALAKMETEETRKARLARIEAYKHKPRPAWLTESNSQRKSA
jgi:hypothetical protein